MSGNFEAKLSDRTYYVVAQPSGYDRDRIEDRFDGELCSVGPFEAEEGGFIPAIEELAKRLAEYEISAATIRVFDYTEDEDGELIHSESYDLDDHVGDVSESDADQALAGYDAGLYVVGPDVYRDNMVSVCRKLDAGSFTQVAYFSSHREIIAWVDGLKSGRIS